MDEDKKDEVPDFNNNPKSGPGSNVTMDEDVKEESADDREWNERSDGTPEERKH